ncbi:MAG: urea carboxylase [Rhodobiaceae bacterium]|nr:urea carboxylase [Rhodobiaceae bacterium]
MFKTVLVANRGEIACRIIKSLKALGLKSVAIYSEADRHSRHVREADEAYCVGPAAVSDSYLNIENILVACEKSGAEAVHPGYGFLSESADFAERLAEKGITFIGPKPKQLREFGTKHTARALAEKAGVPLLPGTGLLSDLAEALSAAAKIGYPVMLKSTAGGGGIGLQLCASDAELEKAFDTVRRMGENNFGNAGVFLEKFVSEARHIEVQIFGDGAGNVVTLGERDCSLQRRNQKVVEETPAPGLSETQRDALSDAARRLGELVEYASAGTVEFIYGTQEGKFYFLEVNTRLQVEHGVTEEVFGVDLVEWMVKQAGGTMHPLKEFDLVSSGAAIEVRINAEDPARNFQPSAGRLTDVTFDKNARVDGWIETGTVITSHYDSLIAKLIVKGRDREAALARLRGALSCTSLYGIETNLDYLATIVDTDMFSEGRVSTKVLADFDYQPPRIEVLSPGAQTSVQDFPGRIGYWAVGVPPSGPMDDFSFQLANCLVGNPSTAAGLECALSGPSLRFNAPAVIALTGAEMTATLDDRPVPYWEPVQVSAGETLHLGAIDGAGNRTYLAVRHGLDVPLHLGSRSTFILGGFGGHGTGPLKTGDVLRINRDGASDAPLATVEPQNRPALTKEWEIGVLYGPHGAPDFFTEKDIETLFQSSYEVHFNSARTGVRLIGPKPDWAREDGGEAGLHPSNIHDNAYAIGTIDFTGDMPIILGPDGPSLGGFVCPATIADAERWKMGQLRPGDKVRFVSLSADEAALLQEERRQVLRAPQTGSGTRGVSPAKAPTTTRRPSAILARGQTNGIDIVYRRAGDSYLLVEMGALVLDLKLRLQVTALMSWLEAEAPDGIVDLTPGIRSLQVHYDPTCLSTTRLLDMLRRAEGEMERAEDLTVPSRVVHLPLSWRDEQAELAMRKYQELVREDAPWCPSNVEFIRRINGLPDEQAVKDIIFDADYLVLGLGDVYLGAPVATPIDPRHRLVTTKYNPARTWTPENAVGIGGAYMCIYGMEGPGGYQLFGRTLQVWSTWQQRGSFAAGKPWLLRFFDRIKFFPVSPEELTEARDAFPHGAYKIDVEEDSFNLAQHDAMLADEQESILKFKETQQSAFEAERQRWRDQGINAEVIEEAFALEEPDINIPDGGSVVEAALPGSVWKVLVEPGQSVEAGEAVIILESMKMELEVAAPQGGVVHEVLCKPGQTVDPGQAVLVMAGVAEAG